LPIQSDSRHRNLQESLTPGMLAKNRQVAPSRICWGVEWIASIDNAFPARLSDIFCIPARRLTERSVVSSNACTASLNDSALLWVDLCRRRDLRNSASAVDPIDRQRPPSFWPAQFITGSSGPARAVW
jgi:hypothetical protein